MSLINARHICRKGLTSVLSAMVAAGAAAHAATPGITGPVFNLTASPAYLNQPDGSSVYAWGYGCNGTPTFAPTAIKGATCPTMQLPAPKNRPQFPPGSGISPPFGETQRIPV